MDSHGSPWIYMVVKVSGMGGSQAGFLAFAFLSIRPDSLRLFLGGDCREGQLLGLLSSFGLPLPGVHPDSDGQLLKMFRLGGSWA